ncbi:MAG: hypothetical protein H3C35_07195 [Bacteroidetes bacterium]|nr:hypothetical protein [Bacteroidota bacterium]
MTHKILILIILILSGSRADDIRLRNGQTLKNCIVVDTVGTKIVINTSEGQKNLPLTTIDAIIISEFNPLKDTYLINPDGSTKTLKRFEQPDGAKTQISKPEFATKGNIPKKYSYPKIYLIPVSIITFGLAWDYFVQIGDIQDVIDLQNKLEEQTKIKIDNSALISQKSRKTILAITFLTAGIVNTIFAFEKVEIIATNNSVGLSYKF